MSPAEGRAFGSYRLLRSIAADAISTTYFATMDDAGPPPRTPAAQFAVRIAIRFDQSDARASELVQHFLADAQKAGSIDHPSIVRPRDLGVVDGHPYVATPFIRAVPLGDMLAHGGSINESAALAIFAQLAGGLDAAHRAGVVHGALSPRTIWVGPSSGQGVAYVGYLTGFGSSLLLRERLAHEPRGQPIDDLLYVAPEQLRGEEATSASDQYALACALYHTLAGRPPFYRESRSKLYGAHLMAAPPALGDVDATAADSTSAALQQAMSKQPAERFASCGMLINAALPTRRAASRAAASPPVESIPYDVSRNPWPIVLAGIAVALIGLVLWLVFNRGDESSATAAPAAGAPAATSPAAPPVSAPSQPAVAPTADAASEAGPERWVAEVSDAAVVGLRATARMVLATDDSGTTTLLRPAAGRVRWRADAGDPGEVAAGRRVVAQGGNELTVLDRRTGDVRWSRADAPTTSLHLADGAVVGAAETATDQEVLAVATSDGEELWHIHSPPELAGQALTVEVGGALTYALQGGRLFAVNPQRAVKTAAGRLQVDGPDWQVDVADAWPVLAATADGVALAMKAGEVCLHAGGDGAVGWCADVPGARDERPELFATPAGLVAATSRAVVALDPALGTPLWSMSPGSPGNAVAASRAAVVVADGGDGIVAYDTAEGSELLAASGLGDVTALAAYDRWLVVGTADGRVHRLDLDVGAG